MLKNLYRHNYIVARKPKEKKRCIRIWHYRIRFKYVKLDTSCESQIYLNKLIHPLLKCTIKIHYSLQTPYRRPKNLFGFPRSKFPMLSPPPIWGLACPLARAKLVVKAGLKFPLPSPTLTPVPTNGVTGTPPWALGLNCPPTLKDGLTIPRSPTWRFLLFERGCKHILRWDANLNVGTECRGQPSCPWIVVQTKIGSDVKIAITGEAVVACERCGAQSSDACQLSCWIICIHMWRLKKLRTFQKDYYFKTFFT